MSLPDACIIGIGIWGPGLEGWAASRPILAGTAPWVARDIPAPAPAILPANERRRTGRVVRLALTVAQEAAVTSGLPPASLRSVFASGNGDAPLVGGILEGLAAAGQQARAVSPTQFHNSVHNAAAGYWGIAHGSTQPATCIGLHDASFAAGLLKAVAEVAAERAPVLFCAYDHPIPPPLAVKRPTLAPFGVALVMAPDGMGQRLARLSLRYEDRVPDCPVTPRNAALGALAAGNPAARVLPLLEAVAAGRKARLAFPYLDASLLVGVEV